MLSKLLKTQIRYIAFLLYRLAGRLFEGAAEMQAISVIHLCLQQPVTTIRKLQFREVSERQCYGLQFGVLAVKGGWVGADIFETVTGIHVGKSAVAVVAYADAVLLKVVTVRSGC